MLFTSWYKQTLSSTITLTLPLSTHAVDDGAQGACPVIDEWFSHLRSTRLNIPRKEIFWKSFIDLSFPKTHTYAYYLCIQLKNWNVFYAILFSVQKMSIINIVRTVHKFAIYYRDVSQCFPDSLVFPFQPQSHFVSMCVSWTYSHSDLVRMESHFSLKLFVMKGRVPVSLPFPLALALFHHSLSLSLFLPPSTSYPSPLWLRLVYGCCTQKTKQNKTTVLGIRPGHVFRSTFGFLNPKYWRTFLCLWRKQITLVIIWNSLTSVCGKVGSCSTLLPLQKEGT